MGDSKHQYGMAFGGVVALLLLAVPAILANVRLKPDATDTEQQRSFEQTVSELRSPNRGTRLKATQLLKEVAYPEAAVPLATVVTDKDDEIQREAILGLLNVFLAEKVVPKERIGFVIEKRGRLNPDETFDAGPFVFNGTAVPDEVPTALTAAMRDDNPQVQLDALVAFGALAQDATGAGSNRAVQGAAAQLAAFLGLSEPLFRHTALRVIGRAYWSQSRRNTPVDQVLGDAVVSALNDKNDSVRAAALDALGSMRYARAVIAVQELVARLGRNDLGDTAIDALARIAHPSSAPVLTAQLASNRKAARRSAIEGLARLNTSSPDRAAGTQIQQALATERDDALLLAGQFATVSGTPSAGPASAAAIARIVQALASDRLHEQAVGYLFEIAASRAAELTAHTHDADPRIREMIANVLGLSFNKAALPLAESLTTDGEPLVVRAATSAVARLRRL